VLIYCNKEEEEKDLVVCVLYAYIYMSFVRCFKKHEKVKKNSSTLP